MSIQATLSIFPKFYRSLDLDALADLAVSVGLDAVNLVVRDGYWCQAPSLRRDVPRFVESMRRRGLGVPLATAGFMPDDIAAHPEWLAALADGGISAFRMGYFHSGPEGPREAFRRARFALEGMLPACEKYGIRAVYQVHHGSLIASASMAWQLVEGLPSRWIGIELDPGNQLHEGWEDMAKSAGLLGDHLCALGVKDARFFRSQEETPEPGKGWRTEWCPVDEGLVNWHRTLKALSAHGFSGPLVFMPFYHEKEPDRMTECLGREVAYIRRILNGLETEAKTKKG